MQFNWLQERPFDPDHTLYKKSLPIELADEVRTLACSCQSAPTSVHTQKVVSLQLKTGLCESCSASKLLLRSATATLRGACSPTRGEASAAVAHRGEANRSLRAELSHQPLRRWCARVRWKAASASCSVRHVASSPGASVSVRGNRPLRRRSAVASALRCPVPAWAYLSLCEVHPKRTRAPARAGGSAHVHHLDVQEVGQDGVQHALHAQAGVPRVPGAALRERLDADAAARGHVPRVPHHARRDEAAPTDSAAHRTGRSGQPNAAPCEARSRGARHRSSNGGGGKSAPHHEGRVGVVVWKADLEQDEVLAVVLRHPLQVAVQVAAGIGVSIKVLTSPAGTAVEWDKPESPAAQRSVPAVPSLRDASGSRRHPSPDTGW
eukprot:scaffold3115_cov335-Prasinococcus_capsulatus_cf.AAC.2